MKRLILTGLLAGILSMAPLAGAQESWPTRPITMVVPFAPGGVADTVARPLAEGLTRVLGQTVVVENKPGSGGATAIAYVARQAPDGYTVLLSLPAISSMPTVDRIVGRQPMYQRDQLTGIARITAEPTVLAVRADSPWKSVADLVAAGKKQEIVYGSSGIYATLHMYVESFANAAGIKRLHVPFGGAGPALLALLSGQVELVAASPASVKQHVDKGALRVLAHLGEGSIEAFPALPSLKSLGYDVEFYQWSGLFAPAATPPAIIDRLGEAVKLAVADEKVKRIIEGGGLPIKYLDREAFTKYWNDDAKSLIATVERIGKVD